MAIRYLSKDLIPAATVEEELYEVPEATTALVSSLRVTNANSTSSLLSVNLYPGGGATAHALLRTYSLPVRGTMDVFSGVSCVLQAGDVLKVQSSEDDVVFHMSYMEVDRS
jgi:hypothetical protein